MDDLTEFYNEEVHLCDTGLLQSATVLATRSLAIRSLFARPIASMPLASPPVVPPAATRGESGGLRCDHCGHNGHVDVFCYRKKKAQAHRSSQGTSGTGSSGFDRSCWYCDSVLCTYRFCYCFSVFHFRTTYRSFSRYLFLVS
jgi:hypothetical protein